MAANELAVANQALVLLGNTLPLTSTDGTVANIVESSRPETLAIQAFFGQSRSSTMRAFPWPFALEYATLTLASDGTGKDWIDEWDNAYVYPADCLQILNFLRRSSALGGAKTRTPEWRDATINPPRFELGSDGGAVVIFSDVPEVDARIRYIKLETDTTKWTPQFDAALAARLAFDISFALSVTEDIRKGAATYFRLAVSEAQRMTANEPNSPEQFYADGSFVMSRVV